MGRYDEKIVFALNALSYWTKEFKKAIETGDKEDIEKLAKNIRDILEELHYYIAVNYEGFDIQKYDEELYYWRKIYNEAAGESDFEKMSEAIEKIKEIEKEIKGLVRETIRKAKEERTKKVNIEAELDV